VLTHIGQLNKSAYAGIGKRLCRNRSALKAKSALKAESALKVLVVGLPLYEHIINKRFES
jgi:hypothetical protein